MDQVTDPQAEAEADADLDLAKARRARGKTPPVEDVEHPDVSFGDRFKAQNLTAGPEQIAEYFRQKDFDAKVSGDRILLRKKGEPTYKVMDSSKFTGSDLTDILGDLWTGAGMAAGATIAGLGAAPSGPGAFFSAVGGSGVGGGLAEGAKLTLGKALGMPGDTGDIVSKSAQEAAWGMAGEGVLRGATGVVKSIGKSIMKPKYLEAERQILKGAMEKEAMKKASSNTVLRGEKSTLNQEGKAIASDRQNIADQMFLARNEVPAAEKARASATLKDARLAARGSSNQMAQALATKSAERRAMELEGGLRAVEAGPKPIPDSQLGSLGPGARTFEQSSKESAQAILRSELPLDVYNPLRIFAATKNKLPFVRNALNAGWGKDSANALLSGSMDKLEDHLVNYIRQSGPQEFRSGLQRYIKEMAAGMKDADGFIKQLDDTAREAIDRIIKGEAKEADAQILAGEISKLSQKLAKGDPKVMAALKDLQIKDVAAANEMANRAELRASLKERSNASRVRRKENRAAKDALEKRIQQELERRRGKTEAFAGRKAAFGRFSNEAPLDQAIKGTSNMYLKPVQDLGGIARAILPTYQRTPGKMAPKWKQVEEWLLHPKSAQQTGPGKWRMAYRGPGRAATDFGAKMGVQSFSSMSRE